MEKEQEKEVGAANMQADVKEGGSSNVHISMSEDYQLVRVNNELPYPYPRVDFSDPRWRENIFFSVYVVSLELPHGAYVQLSPQNTNKVLDLVEEYEINQLPLVKEEEKKVEWSKDVGSPCLAYYVDKKLYRALIIELVDDEPNQRKIQYVDYGNCEIVNIDDIFQIPGSFLSYPEGATLCSIMDIVNATVLDEEKFKKYFEFMDFKCKMFGGIPDSKGLVTPLISLFEEVELKPVKEILEGLRYQEAKNENRLEQIQVKSIESNYSSNSSSESINADVIKPSNETQIEMIMIEKYVQEKNAEQEVIEKGKELNEPEPAKVEKQVVKKVEFIIPEEVEIIVEKKEKATEPGPELSTDKKEELLAKPNPKIIQPDIQSSLDNGGQPPQKVAELFLEKVLFAAKPSPDVVQHDIQQSSLDNGGKPPPQKVVESELILEKVLFTSKPNPEVVHQHDIQQSLGNKSKGQVNLRPAAEAKANIKVEQPKRKIATTMPGMGEPQEVIVDLQHRPRRQFVSKIYKDCVTDLQKENTMPKAQVLAPPMIQSEFKMNKNVLELEPPRKMQKYINKPTTFTDINTPKDQVSLDALDGHQLQLQPQPTLASASNIASTSTNAQVQKQDAEIKTAGNKIYVVSSWDKTIKKCGEQHVQILKACIGHQEKILKVNEEHEQKWNEEMKDCQDRVSKEMKDCQDRISKACDENRDWIKKEQEKFAAELVVLTEKLNNIYENVKKFEIPNDEDE